LQTNQISLFDLYSDLDNLIVKDKPLLFKLFENYIDFSQLIPQSFYDHYYKSTGHPREYKLSSMIAAFVLKRLLAIPDTSLLINLLNLSPELRRFCGFSSVPDASQFSCFKSTFLNDLELLFKHLVDLTEPICHKINSELANILIADTTGFEAYVKENNPKFYDSLLRKAKKLSKYNPDLDVHSFSASQMPKSSSANPDIKLAYINGHFCYSLKAALITNGLGVIRHIDFYDFNIDNSSNYMESKDNYDSKTLIPVLKNFFSNHPNFTYKFFIGDAGFDSYDNYKFLYNNCNMIPIIPINPRNSSKKLLQPFINENGVPSCPKDPTLLMKFDGVSREKHRVRLKWVCPKSKRVKINGKLYRKTFCSSPCTNSYCGRIHHVYLDNDYRYNSIIPRNSKQWEELYNIRTIIERTIFIFKYPLGLSYNKINNTKSLKAEILLAGITQLLVLILADKLDKKTNILSIRDLIA